MSGSDKSGEAYRKWHQFGAMQQCIALFGQEDFMSGSNTLRQARLQLYHIDLKYIRELQHADDNVMSISPQIGKSTRPFIGIVIICSDKKYCIPLSSPKPKHSTMKNDIDFSKVYADDKLVGVLNFNNMIPVEDSLIFHVDLRPDCHDDITTRQYKAMCEKQLSFCRKNQDAIVKKANKLYRMITSGKANASLRRRCCDYQKLESAMEHYLKKLNRNGN